MEQANKEMDLPYLTQEQVRHIRRIKDTELKQNLIFRNYVDNVYMPEREKSKRIKLKAEDQTNKTMNLLATVQLRKDTDFRNAQKNLSSYLLEQIDEKGR